MKQGSGVDDRVAYYAYDTAASNITLDETPYYLKDHQGGIIATFDPDAGTGEDTVTIYTYDEYGITGVGDRQPYRYTGRRYDAATGLYYYRARYYHAALGRFLGIPGTSGNSGDIILN